VLSNTALLMKAKRDFIDEKGVERKAGEKVTFIKI
jgi:hypothetical protein